MHIFKITKQERNSSSNE